MKIDAEKSPFLVEKLRIVVLPSILCIKDGKTEHVIVGFDELGVGPLSLENFISLKDCVYNSYEAISIFYLLGN